MISVLKKSSRIFHLKNRKRTKDVRDIRISHIGGIFYSLAVSEMILNRLMMRTTNSIKAIFTISSASKLKDKIRYGRFT